MEFQNQPQPSASSPVDLATLTQRCLGNRRLAATLLEKFEAFLRQELVTIQQQIDACDGPALAASAHKIKGTAANVSAERIRAFAAELEQIAKSGALGLAECCVEQLKDELEQFGAYLSEAVTRLRAA